MTTRAATDSSAMPIAITLFAVAVGTVIAFVAGRDPFLLYLVTTPFPVLLVWLARGAVQGKAPVTPAMIPIMRGVDVQAVPVLARARR